MDTMKKGVNLTQLLSDLKAEDSNYAILCKIFQYIFWAFVPIYLIMTIRYFVDSGDVMKVVGGLCHIACFLILAICFRRFTVEFSSIDYSLPTIKMLEAAIKRYEPFQLRYIWLIVALLLLDAGFVINFSSRYSFYDIQVMILLPLLVSSVVGLVIWNEKYKPLRDRAKSLYNEIIN